MKELKKQIRTVSTVMDLETVGVWQLFSATNWQVSEMYEKMYESGIAIENQRTGSLLNYAAVRSVATIKTLEPEMYAKINARFNNVDFIANFSRSGYYNIAKPKPIDWSGAQHIKAGVSDKENEQITDKYENILKDFGLITKEEFDDSDNKEELGLLANIGIYGFRDNNVFKFSRSLEYTKQLGSALTPITPLKVILDYLRKNKDLEDFDLNKYKEIKDLSIIKTTWEDYCLYLLNTSDEPAKSIWREKLVTSILSWKYSEGSVEYSTIDALDILSEIDPNIVKEVSDDEWTKDDYNLGGILPISGKQCLSISHYPQESLEMEVQDCINHILKNNKYSEIERSISLKRIIEKFESFKADTMLTPTQDIMIRFGNDQVKKKNKLVNYIEEKYEDIIYYKDIKETLQMLEIKEISIEDLNPKDKKIIKTWIKRIKSANEKWFKESIHSTSSWKRFTINILKQDISCKYLGFGPTTRERLARADAMQAFSQKQEDKEKAKKEAERLVKKLEKENK